MIRIRSATVILIALGVTLFLPPPQLAAQLPVLPSDVCATLHQERARYPQRIESSEQLAKILLATAWKHRADGWGVSRKASGHHIQSPVGPIAEDILHRQTDNMVFDVISAEVDGPSPITCGEALGAMGDPSRPWVAPVDVLAEHPPPDCTECQQALTLANGEIAKLRDERDVQARRIVDLEAELEQLRELHGREWAQIDALETKVRELETKLAGVGCEGEKRKILGITIKAGCKVTYR